MRTRSNRKSGEGATERLGLGLGRGYGGEKLALEVEVDEDEEDEVIQLASMMGFFLRSVRCFSCGGGGLSKWVWESARFALGSREKW